MLRRVVLVVVDAEHHGDVGLLRRRGDHDLLRARGEVLGRGVAIGEDAGRLEHHVDAEVLPRQLRRVLHRQDLELVVVDGDPVALGGDVGLQVAEDRVVLQQVGEGVGRGEIVHRDDVDVAVAHGGAHDVAADAAEPVDPDFDGHQSSKPGLPSARLTSLREPFLARSAPFA